MSKNRVGRPKKTAKIIPFYVGLPPEIYAAWVAALGKQGLRDYILNSLKKEALN